ncbi:MAG TPA: hypothetical protein VFD84_15355 [Candidatus Binatia bacterium]|jgi:hypothetical protein|nr:hypothetical protein [Candidatus Binatia bacterium]
MSRAVGFLATAVLPLFIATLALAQSHPAEGAMPGATAAAGGFVGQHVMTGTVTGVDEDEGKLTVDAEGHTLELHFPKSALRGIAKGDRVTVQLAIKEAGATSGTRGSSESHGSGAGGGPAGGGADTGETGGY